MEFFTFLTPDGALLDTSTVLIVIALMFMYTFVGICAGFWGGGANNYATRYHAAPRKNGCPNVGYCRYCDRALCYMAIA